MKSVTVRNLTPSILRKARALAERDRRSLNQTLLLLIENGLNAAFAETLLDSENSKESQLALWKLVAGKWEDSRTTKAIISDIYASRSKGRDIDL